VSALQDVQDLVVAPDGLHVYAVARAAGAVTAFRRDPATGALTQEACLMDRPPAGGPCEEAVGLDGARALAISPDGRDLYVAADGDSEVLSAFRLHVTGMRQTGCVVFDTGDDELDDEPSNAGGAPDRLRDCAHAPEAYVISDVAVSPDGRSLVVADDGGLYAFTRDTGSGALVAAGCADAYGERAACFAARAIGSGTRLGTTEDGSNIYIASFDESAIAVMGPGVAVAVPARLRARAATLTVACSALHRGACVGRARIETRRAVSRAARFRVRSGRKMHVTVALQRRVRAQLRRHPTARVTAVVSDATGRLRPARARVVLRRGGG
jgi:hypothetical protein